MRPSRYVVQARTPLSPHARRTDARKEEGDHLCNSVPLSLSLSLSLTHTHTYTHILSLSRALARSLSPSFSLSRFRYFFKKPCCRLLAWLFSTTTDQNRALKHLPHILQSSLAWQRLSRKQPEPTYVVRVCLCWEA